MKNAKQIKLIFRLLENVFSLKGVEANNSSYIFANKVEDLRLIFQNTGKNGWGDYGSFGRYMKKLKKYLKNNGGLNGLSIVLAGTGKNAPHISSIFKYLQPEKLFVIDLSQEKINGAIKTLEKKGVDLSKIKFVCGNLAKVLPGIGEVDIIINQLFLQHQPENPAPVWFSPAAKAIYSTRQEVIGAMTNALKPGGLLVTGDLAFLNEWTFKPLPEFENNPKVQDIIEIINSYTTIFMDLGWFKRSAIVFKSGEEIKETIASLSGNKLQFLSDLDFIHKTDCWNDPLEREWMNIITCYIVLAIAGGIKMQLAAVSKALESQLDNQELVNTVENFTKAFNFLKKNLSWYIEKCRDPRISLDAVLMHYTTAQKV